MRRLLFILLALPAAAEDAAVSGARALETVKTLASDAFLGRKSGLEGGRLAEEWMAERLHELGLRKVNGFSYFHDFKGSVTEEGAGPRFAIAGAEKGYLTDYVTLLFSGKGVAEAEVVFAGYGIRAPEKGRDDYAGLDVAGKIVMAVRGAPEASAFTEERFIGYKSSTAADLGARGFLLVEGDDAVPGTIQEQYHREDLPAVWLSRGAADDLLRRAGKADLAAQVAALARGERASFPLGVGARVEVHARLLKDRPLRNVLGLWPGETDEVVVLGAHLDHVGTGPTGEVFNGADDNASGSAMLLEVARAVTAAGRRFRRGILFVWFAGEEQGLVGSWAFARQPPVPLERIAVMINTDMVGQGKPVLAVGGAEVYPRDAAFLKDFRLEGFATKAFRAASNSDHYPFQVSGVPAFFVHTEGPHPNYHQPGDDWENIRPELLEAAGRFVHGIAEVAAASDAPHCRPHRHAEYLWHDAPVVRLDGGGAGVDLEVRWLEDLVAVDRALAELEATDAPANHFAPGANLGGLLNDLRPTVLLGLRGDRAHELAGPATRLGVVVVRPRAGPLDAVAEAAGRRRVVLMADDLPDGTDLRAFPGPVLVTARHAPRFELKGRAGPTLVLAELEAPEEPDWSALAKGVLALREEYGAGRVSLSPRGPLESYAPLVEALGLKPHEARDLLGGNFVRLLE